MKEDMVPTKGLRVNALKKSQQWETKLDTLSTLNESNKRDPQERKACKRNFTEEFSIQLSHNISSTRIKPIR